MSPREFALRVKPIGMQGHLAAEVFFSSAKMDGSYLDEILIGFEIDPTSLPSVISEIKRSIASMERD